MLRAIFINNGTMGQPRKEISERNLRQPRRIIAFINAQHQVKGIDIIDLCDARQQLATDTSHGQDNKTLLFLQLWNQSRMQQRTFAGA